MLGQTLGDRPEAVIVSKFGHSFDAASKQMTGPKFDPAYIRDSVEQSRLRLRRDQIDVILLHLNDLPVEDAEFAFDVLEDLRSVGQIASFGWSTDFPDSLDQVGSRVGFAAVQHAMNLFFDAPSLCGVADRHDLIQLNRSPLAMGVLTGTYSGGRSVAADDVRSNGSDWQGYFTNSAASPEFVRQLDAVRELITVGGRSLAQGALCWLLARSPRTVPLPWAKNATQAQENARALDHGPLPEAIMAEIETVLARPAEGPPKAR